MQVVVPKTSCHHLSSTTLLSPAACRVSQLLDWSMPKPNSLTLPTQLPVLESSC